MKSKTGLDYPDLEDDKIIIWIGNDHEWPHADRETYYLSDIEDRLIGRATFTPFWKSAKLFETKQEAQNLVDEMNSRRHFPYRNLNITSVREMKLIRGYEKIDSQDIQTDAESVSL